MLSFLREQGFDDLPAEKNASAGKTSEGSQECDQDFIAVSTTPGGVRRSTVALAVLLAAGLVCIWFMVKKTTPQFAGAASNDANSSDIEQAIARITGAKTEIFGTMDDLVGKFNEFSDVPQVDVNELVKNPFELETCVVGPAKEAGAFEQVDRQAIRRQKAQEQADKLNLLTIMQSEGKNSCMIDGRFFYEGDSIEDFTITQVAGNFVKLLWNPQGGASNSAGAGEKVEIILKLTEE
ncbi:MAG: hypothetical protein JXN61_06985 [Sedimentisphaerales bacterium]|nr:hypothetical protein [Sedimentisphaerales bacterium]